MVCVQLLLLLTGWLLAWLRCWLVSGAAGGLRSGGGHVPAALHYSLPLHPRVQART
jgi:hypothetical protein